MHDNVFNLATAQNSCCQILILSCKMFLDALTQTIDYIHMNEISCQKICYPLQRFYIQHDFKHILTKYMVLVLRAA